MIKVGDKVRYTGDTKLDLTNGKVYTVTVTDEQDAIRPFAVFDDVWSENWICCRNYELIGKGDPEPSAINYAEQAAKHGIKITVEFVDGNVLIFDGSK